MALDGGGDRTVPAAVSFSVFFPRIFRIRGIIIELIRQGDSLLNPAEAHTP